MKKRLKPSVLNAIRDAVVLVTISDGRITGITGDKNHPFSPGFICPKGRAVIEIVYHPDRINQGLKNGSKLIVVDPRRTRFAEKADHFLHKYGRERTWP